LVSPPLFAKFSLGENPLLLPLFKLPFLLMFVLFLVPLLLPRDFRAVCLFLWRLYPFWLVPGLLFP
jgi:hypothetical protein